MQSKSLIALLIFLASVSASAAEQCTVVRQDGTDQAFSRIPIYDQNKGSQRGQDICFAVVASELIDAWRFRQGDALTTLSSPFSIALNHKSHLDQISPYLNQLYDGPDDGEILGPGNPMLAIANTSFSRECDQNWLESFAPMIVNQSSTPAKDLDGDGSIHDFLIQTMDQIRTASDAEQALNGSEQRLNKFYDCRVSIGLTNLRDVLHATKVAVNVQSPIAKMSAFVSSLCNKHSILLKNPLPQYFRGPGYAQKISSLLDQSLPVGIAYCGEVFEGKTCSASDHTSVVIGRECCGGSCRYLIRDSVHTSNALWLTEKQIEESTTGLYWLP